MMKYALAILAAALLVAADDAKKDQAGLQGTWKPVSSEQNGKDTTDEGKEHTLIFEKDTFTVKRGDNVMIKGTFKLDPSKKPKTIDMTVTEGRRDEDKGKELHGIYELDGDTLKWCTGQPGTTERPTEFSTKAGGKELLVTLKKEKP